jgi:hypothetical protein
MTPNALLESPDAGGFHSAPLLGNSGTAAMNYKLAWLDYVRAYGSSPIEAALFFLLAIMTCSLVLFDRTDRVYWWLAGVFLVTAVFHAELSFSVLTQIVNATIGTAITDIFAFPLTLGGWVMVWWTWFRLQRPSWMPNAIVALTLLYMVSDALGQDIFYAVIPHPVGVVFRFLSVGSRLLFLLLLWC